MNNTKEDEKSIENKFKYIGLNIEKNLKIFDNQDKISFRPLKSYDDTNYKVYKYINIKDIEILITPLDRLEDLNKKYKESSELRQYLKPFDNDNIEKYLTFLNMIKALDIEKLEDIEKEQKQLNRKTPYEIKYKDNYIWQIYYSEIEDKYFMLFSSNEQSVESIFYLIKKKIELQKTDKEELIYVPISHMDYSNEILRKSEISDLENYLWLFTKNWPNIYEIQDKNRNTVIEIVGETIVYEKIKSLYKIRFNNKEEAQEQFKLIKALFILQSNNPNEYNFKTIINENGSLSFCYNLKEIIYPNLSEFIKTEVINKSEKIDRIKEQSIFEEERLELLKQAVQKQSEEYLVKEKQIVNFLECKKTFLGRVSYFFKSKKKLKEKEKEIKIKEENEKISLLQENIIEEKELYTIEDLLKVNEDLEKNETKYKSIQMDIKALENKKENLERKIINATLYINEIESHKKSIFEFWKFTNKDEVALLIENEEIKKEELNNKIKKVFSYEDDIEEFSKIIDEKQREIFTKNECDSIYAAKQDIETFNLLKKIKLLKKDENLIRRILKNHIENYEQEYEQIKEKDFDIFGSVVEDKTKIKILKNNKHREIEKNKYKILDINLNTTFEEYIENMKNYKNLLKEAYNKMQTPYDIPVYKLDEKEILESNLNIFNINPEELLKKQINEQEIYMHKINLKERMEAIFYTNIMFYDNQNKTLPLGMDISTEVLIDLQRYEIKLISRKDFNINYLENEYNNKIKLIKVYEYNIERRK